MDAKKFWLYDFISAKRTFVIPVYQRLYDWKAENCAKLFDDIKRIVEEGKPHFIGTFVHREISAADTFRELVIIDGQQRITSLILFAKAIYDLTDDDDLKFDIRSTLIKHSTGELKNRCKLRPIEYDRNVFEKLMSDEPFDETNFDDKEKNSALYTNYLLFRKKISPASPCELKELYNATGKLTVVSIMLDEDEDPQEIFESLNSTGLALTKADLIRNKLFMSLNYDLQEELYKSCWLEIEKLLRPLKSLELFMIQYLIVQFKSNDVYNMKVSPATLYDLFKRYLREKCPDAENCLKDMLRYAKLFRRCIFDDTTSFANLSALDKKFYELTFLLKAKNAPIILMYLLDRHEQNHFGEETFIKFVDALISLTFRAKVCGTNGITQQFAGNVLARLHKNNQPLDENFFWRALIESSKVTFPNDKDFQEALTNNKLYISGAIKSDGCKYLLYSLERRARAAELPSYAEATVEHILPQKLNADWKNYLTTRNDLQAHEIFLHTLGNLTLTGENSKLGNDDFDAKKKIYSDSNFSYTRSLTDYDEWTSKQIQARAKKLAATALKIWTLPKEFNSVIPDVATVFRLDDSGFGSDFSALTGRKLATLSIFGTEIKTPSWIQMLHKIARQLYALDKDIFRRATQQEDNFLKNLFTTEPTDIKLDEDFYIMAKRFDTKKCLRFAKILVENFDALGGTNCKDDIWFTLRPE